MSELKRTIGIHIKNPGAAQTFVNHATFITGSIWIEPASLTA